MENRGKAYFNKKPEGERPEGDYYSTPKSCVWVAKDIIKEEFTEDIIFEPCNGKGAISSELKKYGYNVVCNDLYTGDEHSSYKEDYLKIDTQTITMNWNTSIITNPPFSLWDEFVLKAKTHCKKFMFIGRLNYHGTHGRNKSFLWKNLKAIYSFDRYIDYRTPYREDGLFHVGGMPTAWFLWDMDWNEDYYKGYFLDINKYATLGSYQPCEGFNVFSCSNTTARKVKNPFDSNSIHYYCEDCKKTFYNFINKKS